jgi:hypothetical protein
MMIILILSYYGFVSKQCFTLFSNITIFVNADVIFSRLTFSRALICRFHSTWLILASLHYSSMGHATWLIFILHGTSRINMQISLDETLDADLFYSSMGCSYVVHSMLTNWFVLFSCDCRCPEVAASRSHFDVLIYNVMWCSLNNC